MNTTKDSIKRIFNEIVDEDYFSAADFHIHTKASDGKLSAKEVVEQARAKGLKHFAICDHNTFDAYKEIDYQNIPELVTGIEFDCWYRGIFLHLLGYGIDINSEFLKPFLAKNSCSPAVKTNSLLQSLHTIVLSSMIYFPPLRNLLLYFFKFSLE